MRDEGQTVGRLMATESQANKFLRENYLQFFLLEIETVKITCIFSFIDL